ncbi:unnamed protein product [Ilex paraguariensis]|uniref:[Histone H3]-lysine(27) N-trimethyltransferase n=1 Tax=Ilex paraguariensis TaxID=185542 RepID=A0ABC8TDH7_9AQUA
MSSAKPLPAASASRSAPPNDPKIAGMQEPSPAPREILSVIDSLKKQVATDRDVFVKKRMEENMQKLVEVTKSMYKLALERKNLTIIDSDRSVNLLTKRQKDAIDKQNGIDTSNVDSDSNSFEEDGHASSTILLGSSIAVKNSVRPLKLAEVKRLPPYTTWIFLDRNQRMTEDQSVVGRRRIYYDQNGGEALICSDSEEEVIDEEEKREFVDSEDYVLRMTIKEVGISDAVLDLLAQCLSRKPGEVKARYEVLIEEENAVGDCKNRDIEGTENSYIDKDLDAALDSFDNLFCRRCLVFDCRLHGCSQDLIFPTEKPPSWSCSDEETVPCGPYCYRLHILAIKSRMTIKEVGISDAVLDLLAQCLSRKPGEVKARYEVLIEEENAVGDCKNRDIEGTENSYIDKDLDAALDSFDNLFCRRCLVFDCRLHGCSQDLIFPVDFEEKNPLSDVAVALISRRKSAGPSLRRPAKSCQSESVSLNTKNVIESSDSDIRPIHDITSTRHSSSPSRTKAVGKFGIRKRNSKRFAEHFKVATRKRQKKLAASDSDSVASGSLGSRDITLRSTSCKENEDASSCSQKIKSPCSRRSSRKESPVLDADKFVQSEVPDYLSNDVISVRPANSSDGALKKEEFVDENICKQDISDVKSWRAIEKALFEKGMEIFGRNSCLIARNLMNGMRTCAEVFKCMNHSENKLSIQAGDRANSLPGGCSKGDGNEPVGNEVRRRSRFLRRRGRVRRLKYSWKSAGYHSIRKRISERKDQPCRQYNPCGCQSACGKECPCLVNGTCCEKYCGCPKICKNRFRGCHCAKSQCRSRQCPCFAADRECDPDVCRNCWIRILAQLNQDSLGTLIGSGTYGAYENLVQSCGDGTLGIPCQRGDNYECRNMKLLLKQQQKVLLGRSDVSGWGAFLKNSVGKHEYLGEYTGELISHREADKRGKIYDRENSSFLFNLNDQFVLDAHRKGDKLKFANHSPDPNCYAKVMMVAGDHRVGIFANERICAGEELFYDYRYEPDRAPAWARKPELSGAKKEDGAPSSGRAKKLA